VATLPFDPATGGWRARAGLLLAWGAVAGWLIAVHVPWRDEVRALTMALRGDDIAAMLRGVLGEGHPALWYLLLRLAHDVVPVPQVLPGVAAVVGFAAAALFALRAPFRWWVLALVLFGGFALFDYVVIARNYGIAMLAMFAFAALRPGGRGVAAGVVLALLANTNVVAVVAVGALLLFTGVEAASARRWRAASVTGGLAVLGIALCFATVYPPVNDAAVPPHPGGIGVGTVLSALPQVAVALSPLLPPVVIDVPGMAALLSVLLIASPLSLLRSPGGFVAALAGLVGFVLFFGLLYPGAYRHAALYPALLVTLHWLVANGRGGRWPEALAGLRDIRIAGAAQWALLALLALQLPFSGEAVLRAARGVPYSQARNLAALLRTPALRDAIVVANPDYIAEPLAYYVDNPLWLVRERRFGQTVRYRYDVIRDLTLADVLADAQRLRARTGRVVVIALSRPIDPAAPAIQRPDGFVTHFATTPAQVRAFLAATRGIAALRGSPAENYEVYRLK